jgi:hypothetical protein
VVPGGTHWLHLPTLGVADSELYVLFGLATLTVAAWPAVANRFTRSQP